MKKNTNSINIAYEFSRLHVLVTRNESNFHLLSCHVIPYVRHREKVEMSKMGTE